MKPMPKPIIFVRKSDRKSEFKSIFLREAVFRKPITAADVRAGFRPRKTGTTVY